MNEEKLIKAGNQLLLAATITLLSGTALLCIRPKEEAEEIVPPETEIEVEEEKVLMTYRKANPVILAEAEIRNCWSEMGIEYTTTDITDYIGQYYITAFCPEECGYNGDNYPTGWITASGTIAHREEEWYEPSTCGINTSINHYGELFYIDGKVFIAEDTGYVTGRLIDTFQPSYELMMTHGSHYTDVYHVEYNDHEIEAEERQVLHERFNHYLHFGSSGSGCPYRIDSRALHRYDNDQRSSRP